MIITERPGHLPRGKAADFFEVMPWGTSSLVVGCALKDVKVCVQMASKVTETRGVFLLEMRGVMDFKLIWSLFTTGGSLLLPTLLGAPPGKPIKSRLFDALPTGSDRANMRPQRLS